MARTDKTTYEDYNRDAFDNPPKGPVGVHRGPRSLASRVMPYLIVVLVAALCGLGAWGVFSGELANVRFPWQSADTSQTADDQSDADSSNDADSSDASDTTDSTDSSTTGTDTDSSDDAQQDQSTTDDQTQATVNKDTAVSVVNATGIQGYAAQQAAVLQTAGYTNVTAENPSGTVPASTVVWYQNETDRATAEDVAATLGISTVEQADGLASPIAVMLLS
ncbi:LytR C-terminal domain-containing protein [Bifidobacterium eulemuris]|uniref:Cell wall integrity and stress response protein 1 n=1 Tax=Bifidobacterium eulemuris TaxID=1765219 RepID=A0A261GAA7_9BIFI|nr:LytR C-terminal domain-containing protein [Bifidobacterium eulemuris]OZG68344.1 cell wall integrity and stress response protein 1 [Bifidobacterium eulemuris]QOL31609.1 LytR C-terminal domain-containing protein [Bifidobacterium eulemuris]